MILCLNGNCFSGLRKKTDSKKKKNTLRKCQEIKAEYVFNKTRIVYITNKIDTISKIKTIIYIDGSCREYPEECS